MIVVKIEYDSSRFANHDELIDLRDCVEALTGTVFQIEQSSVDMRLHPYGPDDEYDASFYFSFRVDDIHFQHVSLMHAHDDITLSLNKYMREVLGSASYTVRILDEPAVSHTHHS